MGELFLTRGFIALSAVLVAAIWIPSAFAGNVKGDFDGDGYADLAIGVPWEDLRGPEDAGVVIVLYGSAEGLSATDSQRWNQNVRGIQDEAEIGDQFGRDLAAGDFDGDGFSDLAVGVPGENLRDDPACDDATFPCEDVGAVAVLYGSNTGLTARDQFWTQASPGVADRLGEFEYFGRSLAAANFGNGRRVDLAIGVSEDVGVGDEAGAVHVLYGASGGLSTKGSQFWHQNRPGIVGRAESLDHFGWSLAAADFGKSAHADLAVGVFNEDLPGAGGAGAVAVLYGGSGGLSAAGDQLWRQGRPGIEDDPEFQDFFGEVLSAANFGKSAYADLAIGVPEEDLGASTSAGVVHVLYGTAAGLSAAGAQLWTEDSDGVEDTVEIYDRFGDALAAANFGNGTYADLAIGVPVTVGDPAVTSAGAVDVLYGSAEGLAATGAQFWYQGAAGLPGAPKQRDFFGSGLGGADFDGSGQADLAVGITGEDVGVIMGAGAVDVDVIYGTPSGLSGTDSEQWNQDTPGVPDKAEEGDAFGWSFAARR